MPGRCRLCKQIKAPRGDNVVYNISKHYPNLVGAHGPGDDPRVRPLLACAHKCCAENTLRELEAYYRRKISEPEVIVDVLRRASPEQFDEEQQLRERRASREIGKKSSRVKKMDRRQCANCQRIGAWRWRCGVWLRVVLRVHRHLYSTK